MTTPLNEQDLILLNAYLDDELTTRERADFESRLAEDEALQTEMESLRATAALLGMAQCIRVPRNFTLDPAVYGQPARTSWWDRIPVSTLATVGVTVLVALCIGALIFGRGFGGAPTMAPLVAQLESAATEAPMVEATEAPASDAALPVEERMAEEATEEPAPAETEEPATEAPAEEPEAPPASIPPPLPTVTMATDGEDIRATERANGAVGGMGPGETEATSGEEQSSLTVGPEVPATEATAPEPLQTEGESDGEHDATAALSPDELTQPKAYTMVDATVTTTPPETWGGGRTTKLSAKWVIPVVGILILAGLLIVAAVAIRRQHD